MNENKRCPNKTRKIGTAVEKCNKANKYRYKSLYIKLFKTNGDPAWKGLKEVEKSEDSGFTREDTDFRNYEKKVQDWNYKLEKESELNKDSNWENLSNYPGWDDFRKELNLIEDDEKYILLNGIALTSIRHVFNWGDDPKYDHEYVRNGIKKIVDEYNNNNKVYPKPCIDIIKSIVDFWYEDGLFNEIEETVKENIYDLLEQDEYLDCKSRLSAVYAYYDTRAESMDGFNEYVKELCSIYDRFFYKRPKDEFKKRIKELNEKTFIGFKKAREWKFKEDNKYNPDNPDLYLLYDN